VPGQEKVSGAVIFRANDAESRTASVYVDDVEL
jgi:hypothetical protein